jgi:tRNA G18 (ribose-2'-O)-methylase SpoU
MKRVVLIAHNLRSSHNVGSLLRTAEGLGVDEVYLTGYTPYPAAQSDSRLPHIAQRLDKQIAKTALGAEKSQAWRHADKIDVVIEGFRSQGYTITALEQAPKAIVLSKYMAPKKLVLIVGREVEGVEPEVLALCDQIIEIPMRGSKESFNVAQAAAMALYHLTIDLNHGIM